MLKRAADYKTRAGRRVAIVAYIVPAAVIIILGGLIATIAAAVAGAVDGVREAWTGVRPAMREMGRTIAENWRR